MIASQSLSELVWIGSSSTGLRGELSYPEGEHSGIALLLNPHPLMGGCMGNNVIEALARVLPQFGIITLRFDYSGVGESKGPPIDIVESMDQFWQTGTCPCDDRFILDGQRALDWLQLLTGGDAFLVGYSFGCHVASMLAEPTTPGATLISPTIGHHELSRLRSMFFPFQLIYSDDDFATRCELVDAWSATFGARVSTQRRAGGNHYFRGVEEEIARDCADWILRQVAGTPT